MLVFIILACVWTFRRTDKIVCTYVEEFLDFVLHFLFRCTFSFIFFLNLITYCWKLNSFCSKAVGNFWYLSSQMPFRAWGPVTSVLPGFEMPLVGSSVCFVCPNSLWLPVHNFILYPEAEKLLSTLIGRCRPSRETWKCEWKRIYLIPEPILHETLQGASALWNTLREPLIRLSLNFFEFNKKFS